MKRSRYNLSELVAKCDLSSPENDDAKAWQDAPEVGFELDNDNGACDTLERDAQPSAE